MSRSKTTGQPAVDESAAAQTGRTRLHHHVTLDFGGGGVPGELSKALAKTIRQLKSALTSTMLKSALAKPRQRRFSPRELA